MVVRTPPGPPLVVGESLALGCPSWACALGVGLWLGFGLKRALGLGLAFGAAHAVGVGLLRCGARLGLLVGLGALGVALGSALG